MSDSIKALIRDVPDFPKKGILFKDITTLLADGPQFKSAVDFLVERYKGQSIDRVVAVEARGFILGAPVAYGLGAGFVPVRKLGKLPHPDKLTYSYELEYGSDTLEMHRDALLKGHRVLVVDDLLATGGTVGAVTSMVKQLGGTVVEAAFLIELGFLNGREKLKDCAVFSMITY
ncbi:MAG: adenine phosphoribosyltransferase [candidate division FCPU426 bacterium]